MYLPNYGVFDEQRYFQSGAEAGIFELNGIPIGVTHLRGHLGARPARDDRGAGRRAGDREPVRLALPGRLRARARAHARAARRRQPRGGRVREHRGRPGRAGLRRAQPRRRPGRPHAGALPAVRGEPHALHDRPARGLVRAPARHPPPRQRAPPAARHAGRRAARGPPREPRGRGRRRRPSAAPSPTLLEPGGQRSTRRCAPACATTSRRTASSTWCWGCRAGIDSALVALRRGRRARAASGSPASRCPRPTRARAPAPTPRAIAENLGVDFREIADRRRDGVLRRDARRTRSPAASRTSPRRTSRRASAATW